MNIENMTAAQLADMSIEQFNSMTKSEAAQALKILRRSVNQKVRRIKASGVYSNAVEGLEKAGGIRPQKGLSRNETLAEVKKAMTFINAKTATVTSARAFQKQLRADVGLPATASKEEATDAYTLFHKMQSEFPTLLSNEINKEVYEKNKKAVGRLIRKGKSEGFVREFLQKRYEQAQKEEQQNTAAIENGLQGKTAI